MELDIFQVDAFAENVFEGNPAAVVPLGKWISTGMLQKIAAENNLSETAFFVPAQEGYELRWFTPSAEVDLCGHATLATAHVLFEHLNVSAPSISFHTKSGELIVHRSGRFLSMDFPAAPPAKAEAPDNLVQGLGTAPESVFAAFDYIALLENEAAVAALKPDFAQWLALDKRGVVVTAPGDETDFVSRCFYPKLSVNEDPVTGSAHCELAPYWATVLEKNKLRAKQISARGGLLVCEVAQERVILSGTARDYLKGRITI